MQGGVSQTVPQLSVLVALRHPPAYTSQLLLHLDLSLTHQQFDFKQEVVLSPASSSVRDVVQPSDNKFSSFVLVRLSPINSLGYAWRSITNHRELSCEREPPFSEYFAQSREPEQTDAYWSKAAALNRAAHAARGRHLLILEQTALPQPGFFSPLHRALASSDVGIAGGLLLDSHGRIQHAGFDTALGQLPAGRGGGHSSGYGRGYGGGYAGNYGGGYGAYDTGGGAARGDDAAAAEELGVPVARWCGLPTEGSRDRGDALGGGEAVQGVDVSFMLISSALWTSLGGLNTSLPTDYAALDLCLRAKHDEGRLTTYVNASSVRLGEAPAPSRDTAEQRALHELYDAVLPSAWRSRWGPELGAQVRARWKLNLTVVWNMECGGGEVRGFTDEAITFATVRLRARTLAASDARLACLSPSLSLSLSLSLPLSLPLSVSLSLSRALSFPSSPPDDTGVQYRRSRVGSTSGWRCLSLGVARRASSPPYRRRREKRCCGCREGLRAGTAPS